MHDGYFIEILEPILPSIHSIVPPASTFARFVTKFKMLPDQFCTDE